MKYLLGLLGDFIGLASILIMLFCLLVLGEIFIDAAGRM